jgi:alanine racemase
VSSSEDVRVLSAALKGRAKPFPVHVKIDTGMGRLGVWHENLEPLFLELKKHPAIDTEGVYTHFSRADHTDRRYTVEQIKFFDKAVRKIRSMGFKPKYLHAANSMGLLRFAGAHFNLVRPGIILYGVQPDKRVTNISGLKPVLSLKARVMFTKTVVKGTGVSYGASYAAPRSTTIATLPLGYSHGYRVGFSNRSSVIIRGKKYPVVGRVTMDQTLVDVGSKQRVRRWDVVTLIGSDGPVSVSAEELAQILGTIPYEVLCALHSRIPRFPKD